MAEPNTPADTADQLQDDRLDEELEETFPASDPPSALLREPEDPPKPA